MTHPWADVREWIEAYGFGGTVVHNLLNDANALLTVVRGSQREHSAHPGLIVCDICGARYRLDKVAHYPKCGYAALPEHLK